MRSIARAAGKLFDACDRGEVVIVVLPVVLAECVFVLESFYQHARDAISSALSLLLSSPGVEITDLTIHLDALDRYKATRAHFVDCLVAATAVAKNLPVSSLVMKQESSRVTRARKDNVVTLGD